jgi:hypothetical protein
MDEPVADRIRDAGLANRGVPRGRRQLAGDERRGAFTPILDEQRMQQGLRAVGKKQLPHMLCVCDEHAATQHPRPELRPSRQHPCEAEGTAIASRKREFGRRRCSCCCTNGSVARWRTRCFTIGPTNTPRHPPKSKWLITKPTWLFRNLSIWPRREDFLREQILRSNRLESSHTCGLEGHAICQQRILCEVQPRPS